ncbi:hypothetical protein [Proteus sp. G2664]|uniref:hypothetical protein n=1 Tax=Proteus sp. G2664 TaxID=2698877 RepID=UPI0013767194|nr:hypothetical protein [Proteus sp. G2664]NBM33595.1 hypothetical protein [Proteus sp. G2664]
MIELRNQFEHKARNICSCCGEDIGVKNLVSVGNINICFYCADLAKELADKERNEVAEKEIKDMARLIEAHALKNDSAYISRFLYQAGYRKVE